MGSELTDYAGIGWWPGGLHLTSLQGPCLTNNFWYLALVPLQYHFRLISLPFVVTRLHSLSSTSVPSPLSQVCGHIAILTFIPQFPPFLLCFKGTLDSTWVGWLWLHRLICCAWSLLFRYSGRAADSWAYGWYRVVRVREISLAYEVVKGGL